LSRKHLIECGSGFETARASPCNDGSATFGKHEANLRLSAKGHVDPRLRLLSIARSLDGGRYTAAAGYEDAGSASAKPASTALNVKRR
jgi:hypothetical protein